MADAKKEKVSYVDYNGYTIVDVNALLRSPKVRATIERMSKANERFRGKPGLGLSCHCDRAISSGGCLTICCFCRCLADFYLSI